MKWLAFKLLRGLPLVTVGTIIFATRAGAQNPCRYELVATIHGPSCGITGIQGFEPTAISPNGLYVTGWTSQCDVGDEAVIWIGPPPGTLFKIPRPQGAVSARGGDVNDSGMVCGAYEQQIGLAQYWRGFVYKYQTNQWIALPPDNPFGDSGTSALNNAGTVVGSRGIDTAQFPGPYPKEAFIWTEASGFQNLGMVTDLGSGAARISENGIVVGWTGSDATFDDTARAFVYQRGVATIIGPIPGGTSSIARGVNNAGHMTLQGKIQSSPVLLYHSYVYNGSSMSDLPTPTGYDRTSPGAILDSGFVTGACSNSANGSSFRACVWYGGEVALLNYHISPIPWKPNSSNGVRGATPDGVLLVSGVNKTNNISAGFILRPFPPIPEDPKCCSFPGDTNCDHRINVDDLLNVINSWGPCQSCPADLNHNGFVNTDDLLIVIANWNV